MNHLCSKGQDHAAGHLLGDVGGPLFLTPLIEAGQLDKALNLSRVGPLYTGADLLSYAGFLTINKDFSSNIFFWFFPARPLPKPAFRFAQENPAVAPVVLWLQGGPGGSSMFGLFMEHGPYRVDKGGILRLRNATWAHRYSMLYVDNPVGSGFSFTWDERGYARDTRDVARSLNEALQQFFTLFHRYAANDFYVAGESYAGKYVTALANLIDTTIHGRVNINLRGIAVGNAWLDPETMLDYSEFLYQVGLVDRRQADYIRRRTDRVIGLIRHGRFEDAYEVMDLLMGGFTTSTSYFRNVSGVDAPYNFLLGESKTKKQLDLYRSYLERHEFRQAVHLGNVAFNSGRDAASHLLCDVMRTVKPSFAALLERNYKVLVYSGQLDAVVPYPLTENFLATLHWSGAEALDAARRRVWRTSASNGSAVAGYVKKAGNLLEVMVRDAGHFVPYDQPDVALDMISRFIDGAPFD
ncbi:hypothetical protein V5799_017697 [Amblyomma americanum]|uniref:Carboxypeptidase n=1 Tax=Amblyomma americanum TaxID=6943 RepID=A0AAQ4F206_AMBAM